MAKQSSGQVRRQRTVAPKPGRRERHRVETRERIFRAALGLFAQRGFPATTVEDITEAADVGKGTFFNYFPSKEHVLAAFSDLQVGKVVAAVAGSGASARPPREVLQGMVHALAEEPGRSPALVRALMTAMLTNEEVRQLVLRNLRRAWEALSALFAQAQKRGAIRRGVEPLQLARAMQQMFFGTLFLWALDPSEKLAARFDRSFGMFWAGIGGKE